jgi:hypothetical protein
MTAASSSWLRRYLRRMTRICTTLSIFVLMLNIYSCRQQESVRIKSTGLDSVSFTELSKRAYDYLYTKQDECESTYQIGKFEHWYYDQTTGKITFSNKDTIKLVIDYEEVGSVSLKSNMWLWACANSSIEPKVKSEVQVVRNYGQKQGFGTLSDPKWTADLYDGWEMTALQLTC